MTLRRYAPLKASSGMTWPPEIRRAILFLDEYHCVSERAGLPVTQSCWGNAGLEVDHVRASGALGMKSRSTIDNGVSLCPPCHRWKTDNGRIARPKLLDYIARRGTGHESHVDPCSIDCIARVPPA